MAYNEFLADRIAQTLREHQVNFKEKKMFGGLTFLVDDKMCVGIVKEELMVRIDPEQQELALQREGCRLMDFTGRPMKGFMMIDAIGFDMDEDLEFWIKMALEFNPKAKQSKKRK